ncbi:ksgA protein [Lactobacillus selangorensis]|uniref:Ribosomal RNA small subunit methyltransferase A n=1 Tax=Lactobacillus selangorensis TaxID=81857 RepID=A0A0R2FZB8_9LACO|nr:16S rRNA (adenine(1518)-N(6)/adenine(1519)-N(6))-dimethyltransferase RsmA [Lactobacillus selangorensis]KRN27909.1 ksgA protein [Lactobacillus selangorensis]KRN30620.1 ksgA protein [Lactobacillus selangorensis]
MREDYQAIANPERTRAILKKYGFRFKKSLGQNFLTNEKVLQKIVSAADVTDQDDIIEVGPGIGSLTEQLAIHAHQVLAFEVDERLEPVLDETLAPYENTAVIFEDILKADLETLVSKYFDGKHTLKIVANLPYYITTPIMMQLLKTKLPIERMVLMMQKEVAERLAAHPGTKAYGTLSIGVQMRAEVEIAEIVSHTAFVPAPNVDSAVVVLKMRSEPAVKIPDQKSFDRLIKGSFAHRRKSLWNNLISLYGKDPQTKAKLTAALAQAQIDPGTRAEQLSLQQFANLDAAILQAD